MQTEFGGAQSRDQNLTGQKWVKSRQILTDMSW